MRQTVEAVFEGGLLRPLQALNLQEGGHVQISIEDAQVGHPEEAREIAGSKEGFLHLAGSLKHSALFQRDPVELQRALRDAWR